MPESGILSTLVHAHRRDFRYVTPNIPAGQSAVCRSGIALSGRVFGVLLPFSGRFHRSTAGELNGSPWARCDSKRWCADPLHEPKHQAPNFVAYATELCRVGFMVPMRDAAVVEAFHEPTFRPRPRPPSRPRLIGLASMTRTRTSTRTNWFTRGLPGNNRSIRWESG